MTRLLTTLVQVVLAGGTVSIAAYAISTALLDRQDRRHR